jgi:hypothetical protein
MRRLILAIFISGVVFLDARNAQSALQDCNAPATPASIDVCLDGAYSDLSPEASFGVAERLPRIAAGSPLSPKQRQRAAVLLAAAYWETDRRADAEKMLESISGAGKDLGALNLELLDPHERAIAWYILVMSSSADAPSAAAAEPLLRRLAEDFTEGLRAHGPGYPLPKDVGSLLRRNAANYAFAVDALRGIAEALEQNAAATDIQRAELRFIEAEAARFAGDFSKIQPALDKARSWLPPPPWRAPLVAEPHDAVDLSSRSDDTKIVDALWMRIAYLQGVVAIGHGDAGAAYSALMAAAFSAERSKGDDQADVADGELAHIFQKLSVVSQAVGSFLAGRIQVEAALHANAGIEKGEQLSLELLYARLQFARSTAGPARLARLGDSVQRSFKQNRVLANESWVQDGDIRRRAAG